MMKLYPLILVFAAILLLVNPLHAALPIVLNSGTAFSCAPTGLVSNNGTLINNTIYDSYYTSECYYQTAVDQVIADPTILAGSSYTIYLHFAEIYFGLGNPIPAMGDGARIFSVAVEGQPILTNLDVHALVGPRTALVFRYDVTAMENGSITISFTPVVQNAKISAIEVRTLGEASSLPPDNAIIDLTSGSFPVEWLDVAAELEGQSAVISWSTAWESNNEGFEIEIGKAGESLMPVGFVDGAGDSQEPRFYRFKTEPLLPGKYLFRLKQRDFDGKFSFSPLVEVSVGIGANVMVEPVQPNPVSHQGLVRFWTDKGSRVSLGLYSLYGQAVMEPIAMVAKGGQEQVLVDVSALSSGVYMLVLVVGGVSHSQKLVVTP